MYRVIAAGCYAGALFLAFHHPLAPGLLAVAITLWAFAVWRWPLAWLFVVPALLPVLNFLPWTGWVALEEFDLLLLATAAGGYARLALQVGGGRLSPLPLGLIALLLFGGVVAFFRGIADAGGFVFDWFGGYRDAMNSLRVFKSLFFAVLLLPSLRDAFRRHGTRASELLSGGVAAGLAMVSLAVLWERLAYPGLLDFSTIYRATAMFWEMHVGGAALDGYLALAIPFAAWGLLEARSRRRWLVSALLVVLAGYACLMTFSRGVYLAVPLALALLAWLRARPSLAARNAGTLSARTRVALGVVFLGATDLAFVLAGYSGAALLLAAVAGAMVANTVRAVPWWPAGLRTQGGILVAMALMTEAVAVVNGGSFLLGRIKSGDQDFGGRWEHWRNGVELLEGPEDWLLGKGMGRMPALYSAKSRIDEIPADFRLAANGGALSVVLSGPATRAMLGGLFGMAQRIPIVPGQPYSVEFDAWVAAPVTLGLSVCEKHLLYETACVIAELPVAAVGGWQHVAVPLVGDDLTGGPSWCARRQGVFSISVLDAGRTVVIDNVVLIAGGRQWLANGDFSAGLAHWFLDGRLYFLPWHIDNVWIEVLLDQGLLGMCTLAVLVVLTLWRLVFGNARSHSLAPFIAAALLGYLTVGLFASLMDVPRVAFLFLLLLITSWMLPEQKR